MISVTMLRGSARPKAQISSDDGPSATRKRVALRSSEDDRFDAMASGLEIACRPSSRISVESSSGILTQPGSGPNGAGSQDAGLPSDTEAASVEGRKLGL